MVKAGDEIGKRDESTKETCFHSFEYSSLSDRYSLGTMHKIWTSKTPLSMLLLRRLGLISDIPQSGLSISIHTQLAGLLVENWSLNLSLKSGMQTTSNCYGMKRSRGIF